MTVTLRIKRNIKSSQKNQMKRNLVTDEIVLVKKEKKDLLDCIASLDTDTTKCSFEAEKNTLLTKANPFRKSNTEKEKSVAALDVALGKLENDLKALEQLFYYFAF